MSTTFIADLRSELAIAEEHVEVLRRALAWYDKNFSEGQAAKPRASAERSRARTRAGAEAAPQARVVEPVGTGKGEPPSAPRSPATRPPVHAVNGKKYCGTCETTKDVAAFAKNTSRPDGLQGRCRACCAAHLAKKNGAPRKPGRPKKAKPAEEPEPVRATAPAAEKRCVRCDKVKRASAFSDDDGVETMTCRTCLVSLREMIDGAGELAKAEKAARLERINRRVASRNVRRHGLRHIDGPYVRCLVARAPAIAADTHLTVHATCGAVVIAGDETDHLEDVHGIRGLVVVSEYFEPIVETAEGGGRTLTTTRTSGSAPGCGGSR